MWQHWSSSPILDIYFRLNYTSFEIGKQIPFQVALLVYLNFLPFSFFNFQMELMILTSKNFCGFSPSNHSIIMLKEKKKKPEKQMVKSSERKKENDYKILCFVLHYFLSPLYISEVIQGFRAPLF